MKYLYLCFLFCLPTLLFAQEDKKYLEGAVPVVDGKVVFTKEFVTPSLTQDQIFKSVLEWGEKRFKPSDNFKSRILYTNKEKGEIACLGNEYLIFSSSFLSLDRSETNYRVSVFCEPGKCRMEINGIRYVYGSGKEAEKFTAEDYITDENALNKNKTKVMHGTGKFRKSTIDMADEIFTGVQTALGANVINNATAAATVTPAATVIPATVVVPATPIAVEVPIAATSVAAIPAMSSNQSIANLQGYKQIAPDKIPGNIIKILSEDWMLVTAGNDQKFNMMTASWGGLGYLYNKPVAFCFINPARHTYQLLDNGSTYTLSFYTETYRDALKYCGSHSGKDIDKVKATGLSPISTPSGSKAFSEAWLIIECRKLISQPIYPNGMHDAKLKQEWEGKQTHQMFIGEIINVWAK